MTIWSWLLCFFLWLYTLFLIFLVRLFLSFALLILRMNFQKLLKYILYIWLELLFFEVTNRSFDISEKINLFALEVRSKLLRYSWLSELIGGQFRYDITRVLHVEFYFLQPWLDCITIKVLLFGPNFLQGALGNNHVILTNFTDDFDLFCLSIFFFFFIFRILN